LGPSLSVGLFKNCFGDANFFVEKTAFFDIGGFTEEHSVGLEEHEFFAKAVLSGYKLEVVPEPLLFYRMHDESNQMLFSLDQRLGEARRIRPYIDALAPSQTGAEVAAAQQSLKTRRSLVNLVARNAMDTSQDCNQTLSSVSPTTGPVSGGTTISLQGVGFSCGVQAVRVDGQECTGIKVVSNYEITCQTPPGSRTYTPVDITADVGGTTISLHSAFTYTSGAGMFSLRSPSFPLYPTVSITNNLLFSTRNELLQARRRRNLHRVFIFFLHRPILWQLLELLHFRYHQDPWIWSKLHLDF
jgi:hypothetical protein